MKTFTQAGAHRAETADQSTFMIKPDLKEPNFTVSTYRHDDVTVAAE